MQKKRKVYKEKKSKDLNIMMKKKQNENKQKAKDLNI